MRYHFASCCCCFCPSRWCKRPFIATKGKDRLQNNEPNSPTASNSKHRKAAKPIKPLEHLIEEDCLFWPQNGNRLHLDPQCSGMKNAEKMKLCRKCCRWMPGIPGTAYKRQGCCCAATKRSVRVQLMVFHQKKSLQKDLLMIQKHVFEKCNFLPGLFVNRRNPIL